MRLKDFFLITYEPTFSEHLWILHLFFRKKKFRIFKTLTFPKAAQNVVRDFGLNSFERRRLAIFACFFYDGRVSEKQIAYLKALREVVDNIILVADSPIIEEDISKLAPYICHLECNYHREYDFGSYKRGFRYAKNLKFAGQNLNEQNLSGQNINAENHLGSVLENCVDELVFCNDSCYAPVYPLGQMFESMKSQECDFWGLTFNYLIKPHIQSYFYVFRPDVFLSNHFERFIAKIKRQPNTRNVILKYEVKLTEYLNRKGFSCKTYVPAEIEDIPKNVDRSFGVSLLVEKYKAPMVKVKAMTKPNAKIEPSSSKELLKLIAKHNLELSEIIKKDLGL